MWIVAAEVTGRAGDEIVGCRRIGMCESNSGGFKKKHPQHLNFNFLGMAAESAKVSEPTQRNQTPTDTTKKIDCETDWAPTQRNHVLNEDRRRRELNKSRRIRRSVLECCVAEAEAAVAEEDLIKQIIVQSNNNELIN